MRHLLAVCLLIFVSGCAGNRSELSKDASPDGGVSPALWQQLAQALERELRTRQSSALKPEEYAVDDLWLHALEPYSAELRWTYKNPGDYDLNGEVNIADLVPIGANFGSRIGDAEWERARVADGDGNGEVNISDVTPIAVHWRVQVEGYKLYRWQPGGESNKQGGQLIDGTYATYSSSKLEFKVQNPFHFGPQYGGFYYAAVPFVNGAVLDNGDSTWLHWDLADRRLDGGWGNVLERDAQGNIYLGADCRAFIAGTGETYRLTDIIAKFAPNGTAMWAKSWGGLNGEYGRVHDLKLAVDGSLYVLLASTEVTLLHLTADGELLWTRTLGFWSSSLTEMVVTPDSITLAYGYPPTLVQLDLAGQPLRAAEFDSESFGRPNPGGLTADNAGNLLLTGSTSYGFGSRSDGFAISLDPDWQINWQKVWRGSPLVVGEFNVNGLGNVSTLWNGDYLISGGYNWYGPITEAKSAMLLVGSDGSFKTITRWNTGVAGLAGGGLNLRLDSADRVYGFGGFYNEPDKLYYWFVCPLSETGVPQSGYISDPGYNDGLGVPTLDFEVLDDGHALLGTANAWRPMSGVPFALNILPPEEETWLNLDAVLTPTTVAVVDGGGTWEPLPAGTEHFVWEGLVSKLELP